MKDKFLSTIDGTGLNAYILDVRGHAGEVTIEIAPENLVAALTMLKEQLGYTYLVDILTVDHYTDEKRFEVAYNLVNMEQNSRLRVSVKVEEDKPLLDSITTLWHSAEWYEREAFDMMGIRFEGNEDLRRIYLPEDFEYHPMRKEFPQLGIPGSIELPEKDPPKPYN